MQRIECPHGIKVEDRQGGWFTNQSIGAIEVYESGMIICRGIVDDKIDVILSPLGYSSVLPLQTWEQVNALRGVA